MSKITDSLPKPVHEYGYTIAQLEEIIKIFHVDEDMFNDEMIGNTAMLDDKLGIITYPCDVENALHKIINGENLFFD